MTELRTPRLLLRELRDEDLEPLAAMNADPRVMEHFPAVLSRAETEASMARIRTHFAAHGFGAWAAEVPAEAPFIGLIGISRPRFEAHFTPCVEVGYRLGAAHWGRGYATEGAAEAMRFGFERLGLPEIVAFTVPENQRSRRVMEKLGMRHDRAGDFDHPSVPAGHPQSRHVLYRLDEAGWRARRHPRAERLAPR